MNRKKANTQTKKVRRKQPRVQAEQSAPRITHPNAGGIDIGATEIYVAVPAERDPQPVRHFTTFTDDLEKIAQWLLACKVTTVAMESTGVYWIPLYQVLESHGLKVCLVNAREAKNVPGRKTDVLDCQWLQTLHTYGLLRASFRPESEICALRSIHRHRDQLVETASCYVQHIQKALAQMNLQLHHVISDIVGVSGMAILDAILAGERNPQVLAKLRDPRIRSDIKTIERSLVGDWKPEHLFTLKQALAMYRYCQGQLQECDQQMSNQIATFESKTHEVLLPEQITGKQKSRKKTGKLLESIGWEQEFYRVFGTNLLEVPTISVNTVLTFLGEVGADLTRFASEHYFASWLRLSPANKITGGRIISSRTPRHKPRLAQALRISAMSLERSKTALGDQFRRFKAKMGAPKAITAMAHKLARILYAMITKKVAYNETQLQKNEQLRLQQRERWLRKQASSLGFIMVPNQLVTNQVT